MISPHRRMTKQAPFGAFPSKLTTDTLLASSITLADVVVSASALVWLEGRATEKGRNAIISQVRGEVIPDQAFNARSRVQEYGGASLAAIGEKLIFSDFAGPLYAVEPLDKAGWSSPKQISPRALICRAERRKLTPFVVQKATFIGSPTLKRIHSTLTSSLPYWRITPNPLPPM